MAVASRLQTWLEQRAVEYETTAHEAMPSSARTAQAAHIPGKQMAKGVVLKRADDAFLVMVLPADSLVHLGRLQRILGEPVCLATEAELEGLFPDCDQGAVPALAQAYGLPLLVDRGLFAQPEVFVEAGDHRTLLRLGGKQFAHLLGDADQIDATKHI